MCGVGHEAGMCLSKQWPQKQRGPCCTLGKIGVLTIAVKFNLLPRLHKVETTCHHYCSLGYNSNSCDMHKL